MLQFFLKRIKFFFLLFLLIISLSLFANDVEKRKEHNLFDRFIIALLRPPLKITTHSFNKARQLFENYFFLVNLKKENSFLKDYIKKLETENMLQNELVIENKRLRELLSFKENFSYKVLPAEIIGRDPSTWFKTIILDKGTESGVMPGSGIITPNGIVGRVISVISNTSKVLLITDVNSAVDAVIKRTRARGIVEGYSENICKLSYVLKTEEIIIGDTIVSSGLNGIFPNGVVIGTVSGITNDKHGFFQFVKVKPSVDFSKLNEVLIVLKE